MEKKINIRQGGRLGQLKITRLETFIVCADNTYKFRTNADQYCDSGSNEKSVNKQIWPKYSYFLNNFYTQISKTTKNNKYVELSYIFIGKSSIAIELIF